MASMGVIFYAREIPLGGFSAVEFILFVLIIVYPNITKEYTIFTLLL